jgi:hypothetical protein
VYSPSTILASGNAASTVGASDSTRRAGADSSAAGADSSSATAALGSSPSQVKSVDFLQSIQLVVNPVRQPNQMYYSGKTFTYRLDRTTVTVGAPRMLVISTSPASAGGSSWALVAVGSSATTTAGLVLPSATGGWRVSCATSSSTVGASCGWPQPALPPHPSRLRPLFYWVRRRNLLQAMESRCQHTQPRDTSTRLPHSKKLTFLDVVSVTLSFLDTRLRAMLRGFLGG